MQDSRVPNTYKKSMKNRCQIDTQKHRKHNAKMAPKIHENRSKIDSGTDLGPLSIDLLVFWSDAKKEKHEFVMPFWRLKNPKNRTEVRPRAVWNPRPWTEDRIFENLGPWGGSRATWY